jgi:hypothetical protein
MDPEFVGTGPNGGALVRMPDGTVEELDPSVPEVAALMGAPRAARPSPLQMPQAPRSPYFEQVDSVTSAPPRPQAAPAAAAPAAPAAPQRAGRRVPLPDGSGYVTMTPEPPRPPLGPIRPGTVDLSTYGHEPPAPAPEATIPSEWYAEPQPTPGPEWQVDPQEPPADQGFGGAHPGDPLADVPSEWFRDPAGIDPNQPIPAEWSDAGIPAEWFAQGPSHLPQPRSPMAQAARELMSADPSRQPAPVDRSRVVTTGPVQMEPVDPAVAGAATARRRTAMPGAGLRMEDVPGLIAQSAGEAPPDPNAVPPTDLAVGTMDGGMRDQLARQRGDLAVQSANDAQKGANLLAQQAQDQLRQRQELEAQRQQAMGEAQRRYRNAVDRVEAMQLDPAHYWRDSGRTISSVLSVALGMIGTAVSGNPDHQNAIFAQINSAVEQDIAAQSENMGHQRALLADELNLVEHMRTEFEDREAALDAAKAELLESTARQIELWQANVGVEEAEVGAQELILRTRQEAEAARAAAIQREAEHRGNLQAQAARAAYDAARAQQAQMEAARTARRMAGGSGAGAAGGALPPINTRQLEALRQLQVDNPDVPIEQLMQHVGIDARHAQSGLYRNGITVVTGAARNSAISMGNAVSRLEDLIAQAGDDIPAAGPLDITIFAALPGNRHMEQRIRAAVNQYVRAMTGLASSDRERQYIESTIRRMGFESDLREGVRIMREDYEAIRYGRVPDTIADIISELPGARVSEYGDDEAPEGEE